MDDEREEVRVGDYVELSAHRMGMVKYVGEIHGKKGIFYGVELWKGDGKHSGTYQGIEYFECYNEGMGVFVVPKAILYILDVPNNYDPFKQLAAKKAAQDKKRQERAAKYNKIDNKINKNKNKNKKDKRYASNNKQSQKPKHQSTKSNYSTPKTIQKSKSNSKSNSKSSSKPAVKASSSSTTTEQKQSGDSYNNHYNHDENPMLREGSESVMSIEEFKSISLKSCLGKGDNFDIAKRICKFYDQLFNDTDTVALVSNIDLKPSYSVTMESNYKRIESYKREGKYIIVYRAKPHVNPNVIVNKQCFKSCVKGLSIDNEDTNDILAQLNKLFGNGCHVVRSKKISFDIYSRFSDGYECELRLPNGGDYILAWRR